MNSVMHLLSRWNFTYEKENPESTGLEPTVLVIGRGDFIEKLETTRF
jgi:hypothetical protein